MTVRAGPTDDFAFNCIAKTGTPVFNVQDGGIQVENGFAIKPGGGAWASPSDLRLKQNVAPLHGALASLLALRGVTYEYKDSAAIGQTSGTHTGFVAQEVERVFPEWVGESKDGMKYVAVTGFEALTVTALRELREEKDAEAKALAAENAALKTRVAALEQSLATQNAARAARLAALEKALETEAIGGK